MSTPLPTVLMIDLDKGTEEVCPLDIESYGVKWEPFGPNPKHGGMVPVVTARVVSMTTGRARVIDLDPAEIVVMDTTDFIVAPIDTYNSAFSCRKPVADNYADHVENICSRCGSEFGAH